MKNIKKETKEKSTIFIKEEYYIQEWPSSSPCTDSKGYRHVGYRYLLNIGGKEELIQIKNGSMATGCVSAEVILEELKKSGIIKYRHHETSLRFPETLSKKIQPIPKKKKPKKLEVVLYDSNEGEALYINKELIEQSGSTIDALDVLELLAKYNVVEIEEKRIKTDYPSIPFPQSKLSLIN
jgi:hypothetical protein